MIIKEVSSSLAHFFDNLIIGLRQDLLTIYNIVTPAHMVNHR